jgi:hypothetical protein
MPSLVSFCVTGFSTGGILSEILIGGETALIIDTPTLPISQSDESTLSRNTIITLWRTMADDCAKAFCQEIRNGCF